MRTRITRGSAPKGTAEKKGRNSNSSDSYEIPKRNFGKRYGEFEAKEKSSQKRGTRSFGKSDEKPFAKRGEKSFVKGGEKPFSKGRDRSFAKGDEKPFSKRGERSFGKRDNKPFGKRGDKPFNKPYAPKKRATVTPEFEEITITGTVRLNKFIANSGVCSRREADEFIAAGLVTVNGEVVTELGTKVNIEDDIRFNGERLKGEKKVYIMLNKPKDYVTTTSDPHAEKNVLDLISKELCPQRIFPVGRLDKSTTGILLLTNDGNLTEMLTHPSYGKKKIYEVTLDKNLKQPDFEALLEGFELEDGFIAADAAAYGAEKNIVGVEIHSGKNRIVRRMFEHLGYTVKKLDRVFFAGLTKKNLKRGQWRFLTDSEVSMLKA